MFTVLATVQFTQAQSLAVGAKLPDLKGVEWVSQAPQSTKTLYIDFFQASNANCKKNIDKIKELKASYPKLTVILLTREINDDVKGLAGSLGSGFHVGYDATGEVYKSFGVRFVPFSMIFDGKGALLWQGNIAQLNEQILTEL